VSQTVGGRNMRGRSYTWALAVDLFKLKLSTYLPNETSVSKLTD
jgi:hypothetical protein